jgi:hypothetical protein
MLINIYVERKKKEKYKNKGGPNQTLRTEKISDITKKTEKI